MQLGLAMPNGTDWEHTGNSDLFPNNRVAALLSVKPNRFQAAIERAERIMQLLLAKA
jgi:hypothetical protein